MPLVAELSAANIVRLLQARTARQVDEAALGEWRALLQTEDDVWTVGLDSPVASGSMVQVEDELTVGQARLKLTVYPRRGSPRTATLELPADADRTRLIRDPFETRVAAPAPLPRTSTRASGRRPGSCSPSRAVISPCVWKMAPSPRWTSQTHHAGGMAIHGSRGWKKTHPGRDLGDRAIARHRLLARR